MHLLECAAMSRLSALGRSLAVLVLLAGPMASSAGVLCLGPDGHVAIESTGATCCATTPARYPEGSAHESPDRRCATTGACAVDHCTDLPLVPALEASSATAPPPPLAALDPGPTAPLPTAPAAARPDLADHQRLASVASTRLLI
jgi:hypothetical protein